jgi:hypothetical protein
MTMPFVIFCSDPLNPRAVDSAYEGELAALEAVGGLWSHFSFESLVEKGSAERALRRFESRGQVAVYRGWMMSPERYAALYDALMVRGVRLINSPEQYRHCHYFPDSYGVIEPLTPRSIWLAPGELDIEKVMVALAPFGDRPVVLKDYVKSRKHEWLEACFIPSATDRNAVSRVVAQFLKLQGDDLAGGLVFREFVTFAKLATHSKSGMPLSKEFRLFFFDGELLLAAPYWEEGEYPAACPALEPFKEIAKAVRSRFFTMDVAERQDGEWMIVELGDAQVAGLPERQGPNEFYRKLADRWTA